MSDIETSDMCEAYMLVFNEDMFLMLCEPVIVSKKQLNDIKITSDKLFDKKTNKMKKKNNTDNVTIKTAYFG